MTMKWSEDVSSNIGPQAFDEKMTWERRKLGVVRVGIDVLYTLRWMWYEARR
jgi:hypothetical protein